MLSEDTEGYMLDKAEANISNLRGAAFALEADEFMNLNTTDSTGGWQAAVEHNEENVVNDMVQIEEVDRSIEVKDILISELTMPLGLGNDVVDDLDLSPLVTIRRGHQTEQAAKCARTRSTAKELDPENAIPSTGHTPEPSPDDDDAINAQTIARARKKIADKFREIVKKVKNRAPGSGKERAERWIEGELEQESSDVIPTLTLTGNAANADAVAKSNASKMATKRKNAFRAQNIQAECFAHIATGRISSVQPLRCGDFIYFVSGPKATTISVGKVVTMYSRTAGKNARNAVVYEVHNISALSRIAVQVFERSFQREFSSHPAATTTLSTHQFLLIPPIHALFVVLKPVNETKSKIQLTQEDFECWKMLKKDLAKLQEGIKLFKKRAPASN
ncbi:hypothetical protein DFP72DRAFT_1076886 [Ephemerocybe angulata]|uniref:Uncharacterized protein n=1 Tax=Ephemerocybe angulata TaxID=980116 RepID=A0A8H6HHM7_9AGAR|nr:hypothetical protein DFP72DRAFT_1076886 [Tulosesus angulatus]